MTRNETYEFTRDPRATFKGELKVTNISVRHPADMTALSNMINTGTVVSKDGWAVTSFKETPLMVMAGTVDYMTKYFNYEFPLSKL
ncbi:hypothetical protein ANCDUO_27287, partial [Ancylostoma duodenale]